MCHATVFGSPYCYGRLQKNRVHFDNLLPRFGLSPSTRRNLPGHWTAYRGGKWCEIRYYPAEAASETQCLILANLLSGFVILHQLIISLI